MPGASTNTVRTDRQRQVIVIPALRPGRELVDLVTRLAAEDFHAIVVVDDGSSPAYARVFDDCCGPTNVHLLRHRTNVGKGAALRSGISCALALLPDCTGVITADADGQHLAEDILGVADSLARQPERLILGVRQFEGRVPLRSRIGNKFFRVAVHLLAGIKLVDTQTGLRGIPRVLIPHLLGMASDRYEFELDMLLACKHNGCAVVEQPIRTVYLHGNEQSHFNPIRDSMRIGFVLLRFSALSLVTTLVDNLVFYFAFGWLGTVFLAQATGRTAAVLFNYSAARKAVFLSHERHRVLLPRYLFLVIASGLVSYGLIRVICTLLPVSVIVAKISVETLLFFVSFLVQRDFVFTRRRQSGSATDWNRYYESTLFTARLARKYTAAVLRSALRRHAGFSASGGKTLMELGGGNSCFLDSILKVFRPHAYHVVDTNQHGLCLLRERLGGDRNVLFHEGDVLDLSLDVRADAVFSVGLVEHFDPLGTRRAILAHFDFLNPGGYAIVSFPTPTFLYRAARLLAEWMGVWRFPDERPLHPEEIIEAICDRGEVVFQKTLWPLVFTQHFMVIRSLDTAAPAQAGAAE